MTKENKEQEYYRFEFKDYTTCFSEIEQSWVDFYDVPKKFYNRFNAGIHTMYIGEVVNAWTK